MHEYFLRRADILLLNDWSKVTHAHVHGSTMLKTHNFSIISTPTMAESMQIFDKIQNIGVLMLFLGKALALPWTKISFSVINM